jgi:indole-3-glycerol phosphate synthase
MSILDRIVNDTRTLVARRKRATPVEALRDAPLFDRQPLDFRGALAGPDLGFIAEIKKASPSKGVIRSDFDPVSIAESYTRHGADAISVLTEPLHFQGSLDFLSEVRAVTPLPLLRKDFILDPYQLVEARAHGADAVLLIAAILEPTELFELHEAAGNLGLACLVELYEADEIQRVDFDQVSILGVNNRDLHTFNVQLEHSVAVFAELPDGVLKVSESGIHTTADLHYLKQHGSDAVLIGETFMRADDPGLALHAMVEAVNPAFQ